ncbi:hypothetical protein ACLB2K_008302 [Fragaria x ananassa]
MNAQDKTRTMDVSSMEMEMKGSAESTPTLKFNKSAFACAVVASVISIIFGYDTAVMSGAMIFIKEDLKISDVQVGVLAGILNLCALVGSLAAGRTSDYIGRRYTILLSSIIFLVGAVLMGYGPNYAVLMIGRCTSGIGVGFVLMIAPVYAAEISSPTSRGTLTSLPELCISIGLLFGYVSNYFFGKLALKLGWRLMLGVAGVPSIALAIGIFKMPESPRWLAMQGRLEEAKEVLELVSNTKQEAQARFHDIKMAIGIESVILFSPRIFNKAGVTNKDMLLLATVGIGVTKTLFILLATFLIDKVGRRKLLLTSTTGMIISLAGLGFGLTMAENSKNELAWALSFSIVAAYVFVAFFSIGLGPITWVYSAEIFPLKLRAQGTSIGVAVNRVINATVSMSFIPIYKAITIGGTFFMFAGMSVLAWVFFFFFLPETKGRSLEEMEMVFINHKTSADQPRNDVETQSRNYVY